MAGETTMKDSIRDVLTKLGLGPGDRIVLHSDLRRAGPPRELVKLSNCGADAIIDAFLETVGPEGLVCFPTFTRAFKFEPGLSGDVYDPETTPSRVGSITNVALGREGRARSLHPTHPWAAIGRDAREFVRGHDKTSTFGRDSVCGRMYDWDAKIVWFGTTGTTNTSTHFPEDWLDLPYMTSGDALVKDGDGWRRVTVYRVPAGPRDFYRDGSKLDELLAEWKIQAEGRVHEAAVKVMRHRDFINRLTRALVDDPCLLMKSGREDEYHKRMYGLVTEHMERLKAVHGGADGIMAHVGCTLE